MLVGLKEVWKRVTGGFLKTNVAGDMTCVGTPATVLGTSTLVRVVTGPARSLLVKELKKPCGVVTVVQVDAGCVIVIGMTVVTTDAAVFGGEPGIVWTVDITPVDKVTNVAAGVDVVIVLPPDVGPEIVEGGDCVEIMPPGAVIIVNVTTVAPGMVVCGFGTVDATIEGEGEDAPLVMIGLPPGFAGSTMIVLPPAGIVIVLGGMTVTTPCGPPVMV